jgi:hypothetical protein
MIKRKMWYDLYDALARIIREIEDNIPRLEDRTLSVAKLALADQKLALLRDKLGIDNE